ncbi:hypothetical protein [Methyloglobulus morosus]|nr:hypothetical protein [Methyloglobulus morosus]
MTRKPRKVDSRYGRTAGKLYGRMAGELYACTSATRTAVRRMNP